MSVGSARRVAGIAVAALAAVVLVPASVGAHSAAAAPVDACALVTADEAEAAVGSAGSAMSVRPGTCSWRSDDPTCAFRALSIEVTRDAAASGDVGGRYVTEELPTGSAVAIEHLHLRVRDSLVTVTLLGRITPDASHDLLARVGALVAARL